MIDLLHTSAVFFLGGSIGAVACTALATTEDRNAIVGIGISGVLLFVSLALDVVSIVLK